VLVWVLMHKAKGKQTRMRTSAREKIHNAGSAGLTASALDPLSPKGGHDKAAECSVIGHRNASHDQQSDFDHFIRAVSDLIISFLSIFAFFTLPLSCGPCLISINPGHEQVVPCVPAMSTSRPPAAMQVSPGKGLGFLSEYNIFILRNVSSLRFIFPFQHLEAHCIMSWAESNRGLRLTPLSTSPIPLQNRSTNPLY
jgi:hypothetical protein